MANKTTNTFEITDVDGNDIDGSSFTAYTSGGTVNKVYEISSPFLTAELFDIKFAQSADTMYLCHPNHDVRKLTRSGHTSGLYLQYLLVVHLHQQYQVQITDLAVYHSLNNV